MSPTLAEGMTGMMEGVFINVKSRSKAITAEVDVPANGGYGTFIAQGGRFGGGRCPSTARKLARGASRSRFTGRIAKITVQVR